MNIRSLQYLILLAAFSAAVVSCKEDPPPEPEPAATGKVIITNAGQQVNGTGSVSFYNTRQKSVDRNIFYKANTYVPGNSLYSLYVDGNRTFLIMAGTGEILVVNTETMQLQKRITGLGAPHQMLKISKNKFYVTDWQEQGIWILNVKSGKLVKSIFTGLGPERMVKWNNFVFVANSGGAFGDSTVTMLHAQEDTVMTQIQVAHNPNSLQIDKDNKLWVLCSGIEDQQNPFNSSPGALLSFDLTKDSLQYYLADSLYIQDTLIFTDNQLKPEQLTINEAGNQLYFLDYYEEANLMRFDINESGLPVAPFIQGDFDQLGYDPTENEIYLSDPKDGTEPGDVYRFDDGGGQLDLFEVGIRPSGFGFR